MGNSQNIDKTKETIIWLDKNVFNEENKFTYKEYLPKLEKFNFFCFSSIQNLEIFIKKNIDYFEFKLFYTIVSGRLAEEYYNKYVKLTEEYNIISASVVYCFKKKYHETKPYFKDKFLNSGGITFSFEEAANYILKDECGWANLTNNYIKYIPEKEKYGDIFMHIDTSKEYELALPILIGKTINSSLLEKGAIKDFQNLLLSRYCNSYNETTLKLIKPSGNKNMDIPLHILSKFLIKFYTAEGSFYRDLNLDLTNDKFDDYHPFIFLLYDSLNKGFIKSYKGRLYRGDKINKNEFNKIISNKNKNKYEKLFYFSKKFLSFSKDKQSALEFLSKSKEDTITILYILKGCKNTKYFVTNIDIDLEKLTFFETEKEVLMLPLTCFEIVKIGEEETYNNIKYRKIYLQYLDKYYNKISSKIDELNGNDKEINDFFSNSMKSKFGESVQKCYDKKQKLSINYCKMLGASPDNNFFLSQLGTNLFFKITNMLGKSSQQAAAHIDDEIPNMIDDINENYDNKILDFFKNELKDLNSNDFNNNYSIGYCLGNFLCNFEAYVKAPTSEKVFSLVSLALGCGLPIIKLIPKIKFIIGAKIFNTSINVGMVLNGLNILWAIGSECFSVFKFHYEHKRKWKLTGIYIGKNMLKLGIAVGFSIIGNLISKAIIAGIVILTGVTLSPLVTLLIGLLGGAVFGYLGNVVSNKIADKIFGKDEFILTSANLYYKYIPEKYRRKGNNPHLKWNKTYLCCNVKSYIIECIVNDVDTNMRVINIPKDVFELPECLSSDKTSKNSSINDNYSDDSTDDEHENIELLKPLPLFENNKFIGDLVIPYKGISDNAYKIDFIIYGIDKEKINNKDWENYRDKETKEKLIQIGFVLSVY